MNELLLNNVHALSHNPSLLIIVDFLTRSQVLHGQMDADSVLGLNFSRATVNGLQLLMEQVATIEGLYIAEHATDDDFDDSAVV